MNNITLNFRLATKKDLELIVQWLSQDYVAEWFYGEGLKVTISDLKKFLNSESSVFKHWIVSDNQKPIAYFMTSEIKKPHDDLLLWCSHKNQALTLDMLIGDPNYLGKGLAHKMIQEFLLKNFSHIHEVLIDPSIKNTRAIRTYAKSGFEPIGSFVSSDGEKSLMMRLTMKNLK